MCPTHGHELRGWGTGISWRKRAYSAEGDNGGKIGTIVIMQSIKYI